VLEVSPLIPSRGETKMKEKELIHIYESPEIEVIVFDDNDHIMTSNQSGAFDWLEYES
jgi:hypothetical protein